MSRIVVGIDPGVVTAGIVIIDTAPALRIIRASSIVLTAGEKAHQDDFDKLQLTYKRLFEMFHLIKPSTIACEIPQQFNSAKSLSAGGDVINIAIFVGMVLGLTRTFKACFKPIRVVDWKGNMSKELTKERIIKQLNKNHVANREAMSLKGHDWDALGIALHTMGMEL